MRRWCLLFLLLPTLASAEFRIFQKAGGSVSETFLNEWARGATVSKVGSSNVWSEILKKNLYIRERVPGVITNVRIVASSYRPNSLVPPPLYQSFALSTNAGTWYKYTNGVEWVRISWYSFPGAWVGTASLKSGEWNVGEFTLPNSPAMLISTSTGDMGEHNKSHFIITFEDEFIQSVRVTTPADIEDHNTAPDSHQDIRQLIANIPYPPSNLSAGWGVWDAGSNRYWRITATNLQFYVYP